MKKLLPVLVVLLLLSLDLYSRAGGGGHGGGSGGGGGFGGGYGYHSHYYGYHGYGSNEKGSYIPFVIVAILGLSFWVANFFLITYLVFFRNKKSKKVLAEAVKKDSFWNEEQMVEFAKEVYFKLQKAWEQRDLNQVSYLVTPRFIQFNSGKLNLMKKAKIINIITDISIEKAKIVAANDSSSNANDKFSVYLKGKMRDFLASEEYKVPLTDEDTGISDFEDVFRFVRSGDKWLLNEIINDPHSSDIR